MFTKQSGRTSARGGVAFDSRHAAFAHVHVCRAHVLCSRVVHTGELRIRRSK